MAGRERDPLAAAYDAAARAAVTRAIQAGGRWVRVTVPRPADKTALQWWRRWGDNLLGWSASPGELRYEEAFRRACYWDDRIYLWARPARREDGVRVRNPMRTHALKIEWTGRGRTRLGRKVSFARLRVFSMSSASAYAAKERPHHH